MLSLPGLVVRLCRFFRALWRFESGDLEFDSDACRGEGTARMDVVRVVIRVKTPTTEKCMLNGLKMNGGTGGWRKTERREAGEPRSTTPTL